MNKTYCKHNHFEVLCRGLHSYVLHIHAVLHRFANAHIQTMIALYNATVLHALVYTYVYLCIYSLTTIYVWPYTLQ